MSKIVALLTDFGNKDNYSGIVKGVLLSINPKIIPVDLSNEIGCYNILSASFLLYSSFDYFPKGTIFLSVVDPGVGSSRDNIAGMINGKYIVCPDNGIISLLYKMKNTGQFYKIKTDYINKIIKRNISSTFHGRDVFAPVCGIISKNGFKNICGDEISPVLLNSFDNQINKNTITGKIIHIDVYGNCITSIHKNETTDLILTNSVKIKTINISGINSFFSEVKTGRPLAYWGSAGFLEIAIRENNAAKILKLKQNDIVKLF